MMLRILLFINIILITFSFSCDPDNKPIFNLERVKIKGQISDTSAAIKLGDTLSITFLLPDVLMSNSGDLEGNSLQYAQFYMRLNKLDTVNRKSDIVYPPRYWVTKGSISQTNNFSFEFNRTEKPYSLIINFKPNEKGIYYIEVVSQPGQINVNNQYEGRLVVDFDVINRHIDIASPYTTTAWAEEARTREPGIYVFRVI